MTPPPVSSRDLFWSGLGSWRDAKRSAEQSGWSLIGTGDWAWVYGSPDDRLAWRITPFDPAYDYFSGVCQKNPNPHLPHIIGRRHYPNGGSAVLMERLDEVSEGVATKWVATFDQQPDATTAAMLQILTTAVEECALPLFMGLDTNAGNVRRQAPDGPLVLIDAFWINGRALFDMVVTEPQQAVDLFGLRELRNWTHIPAIDPAGAARAVKALNETR